MTIKKFVGVSLVAVLSFASIAGATTHTFTKTLRQGSRGADVKNLQAFLNMCSDTTVSMSGAGSKGMETTSFGPATRRAVIAFQRKNGVPATGTFGPLSAAAAAKAQTMSDVCASIVGGTTTTPTTPVSGPVSVALASDNTASGTIIAGQATADLAKFTFTGNGTVNSVTLTRGGVSDQNTLSNVYLFDGNTRLTDGYSFNTNGTLTMNGLNLAVAGSKTLSVKADVSSSTSSYSLSVALTGFTAGTSVNMVNIKGNEHFIATGATLATVAYSGGNTASAASVNPSTGAQTTLWRQAFTIGTRSALLKAANFRITGSAPADALSNVMLYVNGVQVGTAATMKSIAGSNYATFDFASAPVTLATGNQSIEVRGTVVKGSSFNLTTSLQQASDLMISDSQVTGVNLAVQSFTASTGGLISISSGSATVTVDPSFSAMTNVTGGASNTTIAKFRVTGYGEDVKVTSITATPVFTCANNTVGTCAAGVGSTTGAGLQNVTLYFNGAQVGTQQNWTSGALTFNLGSQMIIPAGQVSNLEIKADLRTTGGVNYTAGTISANIGTGTGEGWNSKTAITTPAATGTSLTIQAGALGVAVNAGYASQVQSPNTAAVKIGSFVLQNQSSSEGVRVTSLTVGLGGTSLLTNLSGLKTSETSGSGSTPVQPQASNVFSVDFTIAPGATKTIDIFADTSSSTGVTVIPTLAVTALGASSNVSISVSAVTGQTITLSSGTVATPTLTSSATSARYVAAGNTGATDASQASYSFVSTGGASTITELRFTVSGTATNPVTSVKVGSVSAPVVSGVAWLQGLNIAVPNGGSGASIDALITYAPVGTSGVTPNTTSIVSLTYVKYTSGGTTATLSPSVAAPTITMVGSLPTVSVASATQSGLAISGVGKIGEITVSADAKGDVKLNTMVFTVSSSGFSTAPTAVAGTVISDSNSSSSAISGAVCTPASLVVTCTLDTNANPATGFDGYRIPAGTSKTFSLFGSLTGAAATGSGTPTITSSVGASTFNWDDASTNGATGVNLSGSSIFGFPNTSFSIKQ